MAAQDHFADIPASGWGVRKNKPAPKPFDWEYKMEFEATRSSEELKDDIRPSSGLWLVPVFMAGMCFWGVILKWVFF